MTYIKVLRPRREPSRPPYAAVTSANTSTQTGAGAGRASPTTNASSTAQQTGGRLNEDAAASRTIVSGDATTLRGVPHFSRRGDSTDRDLSSVSLLTRSSSPRRLRQRTLGCCGVFNFRQAPAAVSHNAEHSAWFRANVVTPVSYGDIRARRSARPRWMLLRRRRCAEAERRPGECLLHHGHPRRRPGRLLLGR